MKISDILAKSIVYLYRCQEAGFDNNQIGDTKNLIRNALETLELDDVGDVVPDSSNHLLQLYQIVEDLLVQQELPEKETVLASIKLILENHPKLYEVIEEQLLKTLSETQLLKSIRDHKRIFVNLIKRHDLGQLLKNAYIRYRKQHSIKDVNQFVNELITSLEALEIKSNTDTNNKFKTEIDIFDKEKLEMTIKEAGKLHNKEGLLNSGWVGLNTMLQGGFRRGQFSIISALQHNYKTGFSLSLFINFALFNKPMLIDREKKPLLIRISLEDDLTNNIQFMYIYLKYMETRKYVRIDDVSDTEMAQYIKDRMSRNGYHIKLIRANPSELSYQDLFQLIVDLEAKGYEIHCLMVDYLAMMSREGCRRTGPTGTDLKDMFMRIRNFCAPRKIAFITPHQVSTAAKSLLRQGMSDELFVKEIANKGYYAESSQLDQEVDLELYIHIAKKNRRSYLTIQRGKHRIPTIIPEEDKYIVLPFPKGMPIPPDVDQEKPIHLKYIPDLQTQKSSTEVAFDF